MPAPTSASAETAETAETGARPSPVSADPLVDQALSGIRDAVAGLHDLARLLADRPDIARAVVTGMTDERAGRMLVCVTPYNAGPAGVPGFIAALATDAAACGAEVTAHHNDTYAGIDARFGFLILHVYAELAHVGTVATRTRRVEVTDWQPDPALAAFSAPTPAR